MKTEPRHEARTDEACPDFATDVLRGAGEIAEFLYGKQGERRNRLVRRGPNPWQTWPDFIEWLVASTLLRGNGLAEIIHDSRGAVVELRPIPWDWVTVYLLPSGRLAYDVAEQAGLWGSTGRIRRLLQGEVIHLRDRSDDGLLGRSR
ncbi:phage portal protein, partial [Magnetospirillum sp. UT-4]|uniref:phage portal protein n=1 Tax=Magnetospirillum sp. UT-4 TaxID=2681467 RepID=UPI0020C3663C